ncbi:MAG: DUF3300 domain-containing protein [Rhodospirillales bacterium]|nr:DUF3300 domain-containing protein [Rhodospirillales bacterium]
MVLPTNVTQVVTVTNQVVQVQPANPEVIYVPTYPPTVYYPPPGYVYDPWAPLISFGVAVGITAIIANNCDWHGGAIWVGGGGIWVGGGWGGGDVDIDIDIDNIEIDRGDRVDPRNGERNRASATQQKWQPDQNRLRTSGAPAGAASREARGWANASPQPAQRGGGAVGTRPSATPATGARPSAQPSYNFSQRPASTTQQPRASQASPGVATRQQGTPSRASSTGRSSPSPTTFNRSSSSGSSSAFGGVSNRSSAQRASNRGSYSRGGGGRAGGGGRGGGRR